MAGGRKAHKKRVLGMELARKDRQRKQEWDKQEKERKKRGGAQLQSNDSTGHIREEGAVQSTEGTTEGQEGQLA